jgi:hypothetical protein
VNCLEFRRALGADPNHSSAEVLAHRGECPACEQYAQEMLRLNGLIKQALAVPIPASQQMSMSPHKQSRPQARWYAMAASVLIALGATAGTFWFLGYPRASLAAEVIAHLAHEPQAMTATQVRVSAQSLDGALRAKGLHLTQALDGVSYLQSCVIRGHFVPHLVVQTESGPVTVLLLTEEKVAQAERFDEQQYHGMLVPMPRGAMAVIASDASLVDAVAEKMRAAVSE